MGAWHKLKSAAAQWRLELMIFGLVATCGAAGLLAPLQSGLNDMMFRMLSRPASGDIVIVQIDPKSLAEVDTWPWARSKHAALIDKLVGAGAEMVALDIDFSSPSRPAEDARLVEAVAAAKGRVVLPSFIQHATPGAGRELIETNPLPALRDLALIGNANIFAPSGKARQASLGLYLPDGRYRPTFAALIGQRGRGFNSNFDIDFGIDASSVKRLSYVDVLNGNFDGDAVRGKRVVVGATAIELGDFVPVPLRGVVPGVELQTLIAESLWQNRALLSFGLPGALLLLVLALIVVRPSRSAWADRRFGMRLALCVAGLGALQFVAYAAFPVVLPSALAFVGLVLCFALVATKEFGARANNVLRERSAGNLRRVMMNMIVEESSDGVVVSDINGRIELTNERAATLLNATKSTLLGRQVGRHLPRFEETAATGDDALHQTELAVECDGGTTLLDISVRRLTLPAVANAGPLTQIDVYTLRDVTMKRRAESAERRAQEERFLAERAKSNFIANMSHELRTPLNAIIGFSEMMANQVMGPLGKPQYVEFADVVAKSGHHLLGLVNNILEISRLEHDAATLEPEELDFEECANGCVALARGSRDYKSQQIDVTVEQGLLVNADRRVIKHMLANLVSNAVKFTEPNGQITIAARANGDDVEFEVSDDGVGIDPMLMPHLTDLFRQADQSFTRKHEGMGVGLYLVKRYIDLMKGTLAFESEPGKGTRVRVTLPGAVVRRMKADAA